jgi:hypothetical protein
MMTWQAAFLKLSSLKLYTLVDHSEAYQPWSSSQWKLGPVPNGMGQDPSTVSTTMREAIFLLEKQEGLSPLRNLDTLLHLTNDQLFQYLEFYLRTSSGMCTHTARSTWGSPGSWNTKTRAY